MIADRDRIRIAPRLEPDDRLRTDGPRVGVALRRQTGDWVRPARGSSHLFRLHEGTSEVQRMTIGGALRREAGMARS